MVDPMCHSEKETSHLLIPSQLCFPEIWNFETNVEPGEHL